MSYNKEKEKQRLKKILVAKYNNDGKLPTIRWCADYMGLPFHRISELYKELSEEQILKKNNTRYVARKIPKKIENISSNSENQNKPVHIIQDKKPSTILNKEKTEWPILLIRILMSIIGIGTAIASIYFTYHKFLEFLSPFWSFTLSFTMVCFMVGSFEAMIIFFKNRQLFLLIPFIVIWIITASFSMSSTVNVLYNRGVVNIETNVEENKTNIQQNELVEYYNNRHRELMENKNALLNNLATFQKQLESETEERSERTYLYYIRKEKQSINEIEKQIDNNQKKIEEIMTAGNYLPSDDLQSKKIDFSIWVSTIFKIDPPMIIFLMNAFPAVFIDIMSPLAISLALFLRRKENDHC